jgi:protein-serine/threonine kinase
MVRNPSTSSRSSNNSLHRTDSETSLTEKYGKLEDVLGKGSFATVRLCCPANSSKKYAVKEFRKKRKDETKKDYVRKLIAEFCISSSLEHENIVKTVDLIQDHNKQWCVVMEYCAGGDLYSGITKRSMSNNEIYCYMVQLLRGVKCT